MSTQSQNTQYLSQPDEDVGFKLEKNRLEQPKFWSKKFSKNIVLPPELCAEHVDSRNQERTTQQQMVTSDSLK